MPKLEMYFDYSCPYCKIGYEIVLELLSSHPELEMEWVPCEAHPRPEVWANHSDLLAAGMYIARDLGADLSKYHETIYQAAIVEKIDIEDIEILAKTVASITDATAFKKALNEGSYLDLVKVNNQKAWGELDFPAVPSFKYGEKLLPAIPGVGISREALEELISAAE